MFRKSRPKGLLCSSVGSFIYDIRYIQEEVSGVVLSQRKAVANSSIILPRPSEYKLQDLLKAGVPLREVPTSGIISSELSQEEAISRFTDEVEKYNHRRRKQSQSAEPAEPVKPSEPAKPAEPAEPIKE